MFKMFAILCVLAWPDDVMTSELKCTTHYENPPRQFSTIDECNVAAYDKLETTMQVFEAGGVDFESMQVGCEKL
jgi:hypothetical protein|tara:strand:+ start:395 stop:616 length:222 start_codon:yes stop_codon:yes gene_type:complete